MAVCLAAPLAASTVSPLGLTPDATGESLQKTMIWTPENNRPEASFVAFRKRLDLGLAPRVATLHLFADVRYLLWINGQYILRGPARFEPAGPEYDSVDVSRALRAGANEVVVLVMANASNGKMRRHSPGLAVRLDIDGQTRVETDNTWLWSDQTRYRPASVDWGNTNDRIDARLEDGDWTQPAYDDHAWEPAEKIDGGQWGPLSARRMPLLRETPVAAQFSGPDTFPRTLGANQELKFQLGRLVQAYTVLEIDADAGTELSLDYAGIDYIARAGRQTYISSDTHGFAGGSITVKSGRATLTSVRFVERLYPFDIVGSFHSSDEALNKLWALCARSCQVFSEDSYVDCADRERTEWMDDDPPAFDITRTAMAGPGQGGGQVFSDARLLGELLRRTALTVQPEGWVKAHTCSDRFDIHAKMEDRACDWVEGARRYYESTGNPAVIREIWPVMVRQMKYFLDRRTPRGLVLAREWEVWGNPIGYVTCEGAGLNAFIYKALLDAAFLGRAIGENSQAADFEKSAQDLATAFDQVLWDEKDGTYYSGYTDDFERAKGGRKGDLTVANNLIAPTMLPALLALDQGIVPAARRASVVRYLLANRQQANHIMMFYYLYRQLYALDDPAMDTEVLQSLRAKWQGMIAWPWQTTWEEFDGASKAHIYGMFPGYFLSANVLGVRRDAPVAERTIVIEPHLGDLTRAEGTVVTEFGPVPVSWTRDGGELRFNLTVPANTKCVLRLPTRAGHDSIVLNGRSINATRQSARLTAFLPPGPQQGTN
jgi:alpha-L-rhamnosidase